MFEPKVSQSFKPHEAIWFTPSWEAHCLDIGKRVTDKELFEQKIPIEGLAAGSRLFTWYDHKIFEDSLKGFNCQPKTSLVGAPFVAGTHAGILLAVDG